jgi:hypothetical protein
VSTENVLRGLETLRSVGVKPRLVILDDGWQSTDVPVDAHMPGVQWGGKLTSLKCVVCIRAVCCFHVLALCSPRPNEKFLDEDNKHTLAPLVQACKERYHVKHVIAWHALTGYWRGTPMCRSISKDTFSLSNYSTGVDETSEEMQAYSPIAERPVIPQGLSVVDPAIENEGYLKHVSRVHTCCCVSLTDFICCNLQRASPSFQMTNLAISSRVIIVC